MKNALITFTFLFATALCWTGCESQKKGTALPEDDSPVLFSINEETITRNRFKKAYEKSNKTEETQYTEASLRDYLRLYVNFRLKVREAKNMGLDTLPEIQKELENYRDQLAQSYMNDKQLIDGLVEEAWERMQHEVRARHILLRVDEHATPADTQKVYNKVLELKHRIDDGENFTEVARETSEDPSVRQNNGDLGYFTALQVVYPFETAAYNTPVGEVTGPVRTRFGYHLIKVEDKRPAQGEIYTAHILVRTPARPEGAEEAAKEKVFQLYEELQQGGEFAELAREYSDDKQTAKNGGEFRWFRAGETLVGYDTTAFNLPEDGAVSKPVQTEIGWFIIKRLERKPLPEFETVKEQLRTKVEQDRRAQLARKQYVNRIKEMYGFEAYADARRELADSLPDNIHRRRLSNAGLAHMNKPILHIGEQIHTQADLVQYIEDNPRQRVGKSKAATFNHYYQQFVETVCLDYEKRKLHEKHPEFRVLLREYFDGILLFEVTDRMVWKKAVEDTAGLRAFFEANREDYKWGERIEATIYNCRNTDVAGAVRKKVVQRERQTAEEIRTKLNADNPDNLKVQSGVYERGQNPYADQVLWKVGLSDDIETKEGRIVFVHITGLHEPAPKRLHEVRGQVIADYQEHLEKEWIKELREKYTVEIDEEVLQSLVRH